MHAHISFYCTPVRSQHISLFKPHAHAHTHTPPETHSPQLLVYILAFRFSTMTSCNRYQSTAVKLLGEIYLWNTIFTNWTCRCYQNKLLINLKYHLKLIHQFYYLSLSKRGLIWHNNFFYIKLKNGECEICKHSIPTYTKYRKY